jgi:hypothetical protein
MEKRDLKAGELSRLTNHSDVDETISDIKKVTEHLLAKGPEACKQFLIDAGKLNQRP